MYISAIDFLVGHEFTHRMQDLSPEAYAAYKESVKAYMGEEVWNERMARMRSIYTLNRVSASDTTLEDEIVADFTGMMVEKYDVFNKYLEANKENKGLIQAIADVLRSILDKLRAITHRTTALDNVMQTLDSLISSASAVAESADVANSDNRNSLPSEVLAEIEAERKAIIDTAKANGTYLKAPNGKKTNLTPKQWVDVRTSRFKKWFGDWEKAARIEKLRSSESVVVPEDVNVGKYELNRESAEAYLLNELRGEYNIADTNEQVTITRKGAKKVTSHSAENIAHLKSIAVIPQMLENAIFIDEVGADKDNAQYDAYRYYVCGLRIGNEDYTVRITIGVKGGKYYYDHSLTSIEKGNLIEIAQGFTPNGGRTLPSYAENKDTRIIPILQTNSSKIVDANGEPRVVYHGTNADFWAFNPDVRHTHDKGFYGKGIYFTFGDFAPKYEALSYGDRVIDAFVNIRKPFDFSQLMMYNGVDINSSGGSTLAFYYNIAKNFPELEGIVELPTRYKMENDTKKVLSPLSYKEFVKLTDDISSKLRISRYDDIRGNQVYDVDYVTGEVEEYSGVQYPVVKTLMRGVRGDKEQSSVASSVFTALENVFGFDPEFHPEGVMTRNPEITQAIKDRGFDGILQSATGDELLVFNPNQIKSATDNVGTYDGNNPDIRFSLRSDVADILNEYDTDGVKYGSMLDVADGIEAVIAESTEDTAELENILNDFRAAQDDARRWGNRMDSGGEEEFEEALRAYVVQSKARYHLSNPYGGNSGYVGYSMSKRAAEAREEGRYPKSDFKKVYDMPQATLDALVNAGVINDKEWHHTSVYGNKTTFYGWGAYGESPYMSEYYKAHKTEIDEAAKSHGDLTPFLDGFEKFEADVDANNTFIAQLKVQAEAERETQRREEEQLFQKRIDEQKREMEDSERKRAYVEANLPAEFVASNGVTIKPKGYGEYPAYRDGEAITSASSSNKRKAASKARAEFKEQIIAPLEGSYASQSEETEDDGYRYSLRETDPAVLEQLNTGETIKVYRAMQVIDGKLYPPMSAKVDGKMREPIELGVWERAEERPDLADAKGYFKLDKGNKSSLKARYNPYIHTSITPLNDQFSSAQDRPNLVTVEVEIPASELTSGYKAEKAKDAVGKLEWKAGVVQSQLSGTRTVILSRWDRPLRIVPESEVAQRIVEMFGDTKVVMPSNVVTPSLRAELEKLGVHFKETDNQGKAKKMKGTADRNASEFKQPTSAKRSPFLSRFGAKLHQNAGIINRNRNNSAFCTDNKCILLKISEIREIAI